MASIAERSAVFKTPWFNVISKKVRGIGDDKAYFSLEMSDFVSVVAIAPDDKILLVNQYRPAVEQKTLELPGGHVDGTETPYEAAKRELLEETGYVTAELVLLSNLYADVGRLNNRAWTFFARAYSTGQSIKPENDLSVATMPLRELLHSLKTNQPLITHSPHIAAIGLAILHGHISSSI